MWIEEGRSDGVGENENAPSWCQGGSGEPVVDVDTPGEHVFEAAFLDLAHHFLHQLLRRSVRRNARTRQVMANNGKSEFVQRRELIEIKIPLQVLGGYARHGTLTVATSTTLSSLRHSDTRVIRTCRFRVSRQTSWGCGRCRGADSSVRILGIPSAPLR